MARGDGIINIGTRVTARSGRTTFRKVLAAHTKILSGLRRNVRDFHARVKKSTERLAPVKTGFMASHVETRYEKGGDRLSAETGWWRDTFMRHRRQTKGRFYPPYPEFGTERSPAKPSLTPSFRRYEKSFLSDVKKTLREGARR